VTVLIHGPARTYGVLAAHCVQKRLFTQDDQHFLQAVANVLADVIDRNRAEEEARQRQSQLAHVMRLNTMGKMVSELAHEINQPLYAIANYAAACREVLATQAVEVPADMRHWMQQISDQASRAGEILRRLGEFVRKDASRRGAISLNTLIRNVAGLVEIDARVNEVQLQLELDDAAAQVIVDRVQIEQVIVNLVVNAIEAMQPTEPRRRQVKIRTRVVHRRVHVEVEDAGQGVGNEQFLHLFDAFFTTKLTGMGMGLSISRSIIEAHNGELSASRNAGPGMTFRFWLPLASGD
jgi:C4-dicarboxylate-specific signal transduction histidine kinase